MGTQAFLDLAAEVLFRLLRTPRHPAPPPNSTWPESLELTVTRAATIALDTVRIRTPVRPRGYLEVGEGNGYRADGRRPILLLLHRAAPEPDPAGRRGGEGGGDYLDLAPWSTPRGWTWRNPSGSGSCSHGAAHLRHHDVALVSRWIRFFWEWVWRDLVLVLAAPGGGRWRG